jgi:hypothetical protein
MGHCQVTGTTAATRQRLVPLHRPRRASAHCSPQTIYGSSVERTAKLLPLWQLKARFYMCWTAWKLAWDGSMSVEKRRIDLGHGAALLDHGNVSGLARGRPSGEATVEAHAQGHHQVDGAYAQDGGDQPGPLDHLADPDGSPLGCRPAEMGNSARCHHPPTAAAP